MTQLINETLGKYTILEQIGQGGMASVYRAYDQILKRDVAIKVVRTNDDDESTRIKRFKREAKTLANLNHPNIVSVLDFGEQDGFFYLVMEYLPGDTLRKKMAHPLSYREAAALLLPIAEALEFAHANKIVHRDVKPANIIFTNDGRPMLSDFGIVSLLENDDETLLTATEVGIGTPEYMAPEQISGKQIDHRADIYALGVVLYEMISGNKPFDGDTAFSILLKKNNQNHPSIRSFDKKIPIEIEKAIDKAIEKEPAKRYQDMNQFINVLKNMESGNLRQISKINQLPSRRKRFYLISSAFVILFVVVSIWNFWGQDWVDKIAQAILPSNASNEILPTGTATPTITKIVPTATNTATITPTPFTIVKVNTPIPQSNVAISPSNVDQVRELARWGDGRITDIQVSKDGSLLVVSTSMGIGIHNPNDGKLIRWIDTDDWIWRVTISPDNSMIASWADNGEVTIWNTVDGRKVTKISEVGKYLDSRLTDEEFDSDDCRYWSTCSRYKYFLSNMLFSPDNKYLIVKNNKNELRIYNINHATIVNTKSFDQDLISINFSPYGNLLAIAFADQTIHMVNFPDFSFLYSMDLTTDRETSSTFGSNAMSMLFSSDSQFFFTSTIYDYTKIWDIKTGLMIREIKSKGSIVTLSPDNNYFVIENDNKVINRLNIFNTRDGKDIYGYDYEGIYKTSFINNGDNLLIIYLNGTILNFEFNKGKLKEKNEYELENYFGKSTLPVQYEFISSPEHLAFSSDSILLASSSPLIIRNTNNGDAVFAPEEGKIAYGFSFYEDDQKFSALCRQDSTIFFHWNTEDWTFWGLPYGLNYSRNPNASSGYLDGHMVFSDDGNLFAWGDNVKRTKDGSTTKWGNFFSHQGIPYIINIDYEKKEILLINDNNGNKTSLELVSEMVLPNQSWDYSESPYRIISVGFSPDDSLIVFQLANGKIIISNSDGTTDSVLNESENIDIKESSLNFNRIAFSPDGQILAVAKNDNSIMLYRFDTKEKYTLTGHRNWIYELRFSPDGKLLASISEDGTIRLWGVPKN